MRSPEPVKFLLVDDVEENLAALKALLQRDDLALFAAKSGTEALELLLVHDFALALLDVQMPGMDGFELAELMRGIERTRRVPIIFLTAVATDDRRRFRGYEAGAVDYLLKPVDPHMLKHKVAVFFELERQRQELAAQRDSLRVSAEQLAAALGRVQAHGDNSPLALVEFDANARIVAWSKGAERMFGWSAPEVLRRGLMDLPWLEEQEVEAVDKLFSEMLSGKQLRCTRTIRTFAKDRSPVQCEWYISALLNSAGRLTSVNVQILDITERTHAEQTQRLLISELNHRVKNMLAIVQAIATQTLRYSRNPSDFTANFSGRIQSLARAYSLLGTSASSQGADLADLIKDQLSLGAIDGARLTATGPEVRLPPQLALHVALILHELGVNANKYGALSRAAGRINLAWSIDDNLLRLSWNEHGGPAVKAPLKRGFGTTLIEQSARAEGGAAHAHYRADGMGWEITLAIPSLNAAELMHSPGPEPAKSGTDERGTGSTEAPNALIGRRMLVIEDESIVALELASLLQDAGADVVGQAGSVDQALRLIETVELDGALVDANLRGSPVDEVAAALTRRNVPFMFVTGYGSETLPRAFSSAPVLPKPFTPVQLLDAAASLFSRSGTVVALPRQQSAAGPAG